MTRKVRSYIEITLISEPLLGGLEDMAAKKKTAKKAKKKVTKKKKTAKKKKK